jgi:hypothetical protein
VARGPVFKEILRSLTLGGAEVLSMAPVVQIVHRWAGSELLSPSPLRVSLVNSGFLPCVRARELRTLVLS